MSYFAKKICEDLSRYLNKKLSYRTRTARRAMLINSRYMIHEVWELERFQTAKSDLQGHSRASIMVPFDRSHTISH